MAFLVVCLLGLLDPSRAFAWGYQGHRVIGSIADHLLTDNARTQVQAITNEGAKADPKSDLDLRRSVPGRIA
jgi:hypothetical protein